MDDVTRDPRDELMPYGVDTVRLRISVPALPVVQGYNGRAWNMRPLRGWTGGQAAAAEPAAGAEQGRGYAGEGAVIPVAGRVPAVANGTGGTVPNAGGGVTNAALDFDPSTQGFPAVVPDGSNVSASHSSTGLLQPCRNSDGGWA